MTNQDQMQALRQALNGFAATLNAANAAELPGLFTDGGKFMPEGLKTIDALSLQSSGDRFLQANAFQISFEILDINIDGDFATVISNAKTSEKRPNADLAINKTSRDFFVFKKVGHSWKIDRYIFNNVTLN